MTPLLPSYWTFGSNYHDDTTETRGGTIRSRAQPWSEHAFRTNSGARCEHGVTALLNPPPEPLPPPCPVVPSLQGLGTTNSLATSPALTFQEKARSFCASKRWATLCWATVLMSENSESRTEPHARIGA
jgi:hypothetical protein